MNVFFWRRVLAASREASRCLVEAMKCIMRNASVPNRCLLWKVAQTVGCMKASCWFWLVPVDEEVTRHSIAALKLQERRWKCHGKYRRQLSGLLFNYQGQCALGKKSMKRSNAKDIYRRKTLLSLVDSLPFLNGRSPVSKWPRIGLRYLTTISAKRYLDVQFHLECGRLGVLFWITLNLASCFTNPMIHFTGHEGHTRIKSEFSKFTA